MRLQLSVLAGPDKGRFFVLQPGLGMMLGRAVSAQYRLHDLSVARSHCEILFEDGVVSVMDFDSADGVFVNGEKVEKAKLKLGDVLKVGQSELRLQDGDFTEPPATANPVQTVNKADEPVAKAVRPLAEMGGKTINHFELGPILGSGPASMVFKARDLQTDESVALKVIFPDFGQKDEEIQLFAKAMRSVMNLEHPHLVRVFGAGKHGTHCWIAMELVEGFSLKHILKQMAGQPAPDWKAPWRLCLQIARALAYAHEHGVYHGCIYPENILIHSGDQMGKLSDLVLARVLEKAASPEISQPSNQEAHLPIMSPERTHGWKKVDARSDIYSLGASIYTLLAGRPPCTGETYLEKITKVRQGSPSRLAQFCKNVYPQFEAILMKMLAKKPEDRFQNGTELVAELETVGKEALSV